MTTLKKSIFGLSVTTGLLFSGAALADAQIDSDDGTTSLTATAHVDLCVVVPEILIFGVGPKGDTISKICWDCAPASGIGTLPTAPTSYSGDLPTFDEPAPFSTTANVSAVAAGGTTADVGGISSTTASLPVYIFNNGGAAVSIAATFAGSGTAGDADHLGNTTIAAGSGIPVGEFKLASDSSDINHPVPTGFATGANAGATPQNIAVNTDGVVNYNTTWTYEYTPASIPVAGKYEGQITYVATAP